MPTDKQISDLTQKIQDKLGQNRTQRSTLNQAEEAITSIKMNSREVEETPAVSAQPGKDAVMDGETEVEPAVSAQPGTPAVTKRVFDVLPKDPMIPAKDMDNTRRQEIFDATKSIIDSL